MKEKSTLNQCAATLFEFLVNCQCMIGCLVWCTTNSIQPILNLVSWQSFFVCKENQS